MTSSGDGEQEILRRAVELAIDAGVAHDGLDVFAGLGKGDRLHELRRVAVGALSHPFLNAVGTSVVGGQCVFERSSKLIDHAFEIACTQFEIDRGRKQLAGVIALQDS